MPEPSPRKVALFSGHMIDAPDRPSPRFPPDKEPIARRAIDDALDDLDVGGADLAVCGGACGGDLLFAEAATARGARLELYIPFDEATFLKNSVDFAGDAWRDRFDAMKARATLHIRPDELGPLPAGADPYELNNLWMLAQARRFGANTLDFVCLWNGQSGDGPGGTRHMMEEAQKAGGQAIWLDTSKLWG